MLFPLIVASALFMSSYDTAWVERRKCLSSLAFCLRMSSACSSLEAIGADEYRRFDGLVRSREGLSVDVGEVTGDCCCVPFVFGPTRRLYVDGSLCPDEPPHLESM